MEIQLLRADRIVHSLRVRATPVHVGRAAGNELVVSDATVSGHHLLLWEEGGTLWVKDLGSTNGTFVNDRRLRGAEPVRGGDLVRLGSSCVLRVHADDAGAEEAQPHRPLAVEDIDAGVRIPFRGDRFVIGGAPEADLPLEGGPSQAAVIMRHVDGELRIGTADGEEGPLARGAPFSVGSRLFRVVEVDVLHVATELPPVERYDVRIRCTLDGPRGAEAVLEDPPTGRVHRVGTGNRAVLLYLLARRHQEDQAKGVPPAERGWCPDEDVMLGIWGRQGDDNKLNVLLYRVRAELREAGFDPWCIEKRQRYVRLRVAEVELR